MFGVCNKRNQLSKIFVSKSLKQFLDSWSLLWYNTYARLNLLLKLRVLLNFTELFRKFMSFGYFCKDLVSLHISFEAKE